MIAKPPPREGSMGFLLLPPFRVQGVSVAGEATSIAVPELDLCFDMGSCPRAMLPSKFVAISHGHMDHIGGLAYFCSQRWFQGMGEGAIVCDARIAPHIQRMMEGYIELEQQKTPFKLLPLQPDGEIMIKNGVFLRGFPVEHTVPAFGYAVVERRTKLKDEFVGMPQEKLRELKDRGTEITRVMQVPLIAYMGDTQPGPHLIRDDVRKSQIVICECTFAENEHRDRAKVGMHMHADQVAEWLRVLECQTLVLTHVSRRTNLSLVRKRLIELCGAKLAAKVHILMDYRVNKERYEKQAAEAEVLARQQSGRKPAPADLPKE
jgi:ribonuclease Z